MKQRLLRKLSEGDVDMENVVTETDDDDDNDDNGKNYDNDDNDDEKLKEEARSENFSLFRANSLRRRSDFKLLMSSVQKTEGEIET